MPPNGNPSRLADCTNYPLCGQARGKIALEWYSGPGEYCPECGEKLTLRGDAVAAAEPDPAAATLVSPTASSTPPAAAATSTFPASAASAASAVPAAGPATAAPNAPPSFAPANGAGAPGLTTTRGAVAGTSAKAAPGQAAEAKPRGAQTAKGAPAKVPTVKSPAAPTAEPAAAPPPPPPKPRVASAQNWFWAVAAIFIVSGAIGYAVYRGTTTRKAPAGTLSVCSIPNAVGLARDLILAYSAKTGTPESRFSLGGSAAGTACDLRFTTAPETPDSVIASDGVVVVVNPINDVARLSEKQLRDIFSGAVRDWSQLGGEPGAIVPILPDASTEEAKMLSASLFFGLAIDRRVRRLTTSSDVTHAVTGADRDSSRAIGMVSFSQALAAKVVPIAYLPAPSVLTIASHRYPYTISIAIESPSGRTDPAISGLIDYARSSFGAAIVQINGLIPRTGV